MRRRAGHGCKGAPLYPAGQPGLEGEAAPGHQRRGRGRRRPRPQVADPRVADYFITTAWLTVNVNSLSGFSTT